MKNFPAKGYDNACPEQLARAFAIHGWSACVKDTSPEVDEMAREMMMSRSGEERFIMGALMFDAARELIIASLPQDLPPVEFKRRLFQRIYGQELESFIPASGKDDGR